jgi:ABC-type uncharacterized transport system permease subunit
MPEIFSQLLALFASPEFYAAGIRLTTPLLLAAIGSLFCERAGIMNIALEGWMLFGAMTGLASAFYLGGPWQGLLVAAITGLLVGLVFALFVVTIGTDQIVTAVAMNILAFGATSLVYRRLFGQESMALPVDRIPDWPIPWLSQVPVLGDIFFNQLPLVYLAFALVPISHFVMFHTTWGLKVRAVGESPRAADSVGVNVVAVRYTTLMLAGMLAAMGGAFLSIGQTTIFQEGMTGGRGYIAYTAIVFGRWTPVGTLIGTLVFGFADAFQLRVQALGLGIPYQFALMIPYLLTIAAVVFAVGRTIWPAAYGIPYRREARRGGDSE